MERDVMRQRLRLVITALLVCVLVSLVGPLRAQSPTLRSAEAALKSAQHTEEVQGDLNAAITQYQAVVDKYGKTDRAVAAEALLHMGRCHEKLGDTQARGVFEKVLNEFSDQTAAVDEARRDLAVLAATPVATLDGKKIGEFSDARHYGTAVSRDGRYLAFTRTGQIFVQDVTTGRERLVQAAPPPGNLPGYSFGATISPDGRSVLYSTGRPAPGATDSRSEVYVIGVDGSNSHRVATGADSREFADQAVWSPDGNRVLIAFNDPPDDQQRLLIVSLGDGSSRVLARHARTARFSPDGRFVAFRGDGPGGSGSGGYVLPGIYVISVNGGAPTLIAQGDPLSVRNPIWTSQGTQLLFGSRHPGQPWSGDSLWDLYAIRVVNGAPASSPRLVKADVEWPTATLDVTASGEVFSWRDTARRELYEVDVDPTTGQRTAAPQKVTLTDAAPLNGVSWSPDGTYLAYYTDDLLGTGALAVRTVKTGEERRLSPPGLSSKPIEQPGKAILWFPDSHSLLLHYGNGEMFRFDTLTGESRRLLDGFTVPRVNNDSWMLSVLLSPDGKTIYYRGTAAANKQPTIVRRDLSGGAEIEVCRVPGDFIHDFRLSRDGSQLAIIVAFSPGQPAEHRTIMTVPASGGEPKEIFAPAGLARQAIWSRDGHQLFVSIRPAENSRNTEVFSIPANGGAAQPLGLALHAENGPGTLSVGGRGFTSLGISQDGRRLFFVDIYQPNELWAVKVQLAQR